MPYYPAMCLQALQISEGVVMIRPDDVANGDRERTLALLWELAVHFQVFKRYAVVISVIMALPAIS